MKKDKKKAPPSAPKKEAAPQDPADRAQKHAKIANFVGVGVLVLSWLYKFRYIFAGGFRFFAFMAHLFNLGLIGAVLIVMLKPDHKLSLKVCTWLNLLNTEKGLAFYLLWMAMYVFGDDFLQFVLALFLVGVATFKLLNIEEE